MRSSKTVFSLIQKRAICMSRVILLKFFFYSWLLKIVELPQGKEKKTFTSRLVISEMKRLFSICNSIRERKSSWFCMKSNKSCVKWLVSKTHFPVTLNNVWFHSDKHTFWFAQKKKNKALFVPWLPVTIKNEQQKLNRFGSQIKKINL